MTTCEYRIFFIHALAEFYPVDINQVMREGVYRFRLRLSIFQLLFDSPADILF